MLSWPFPIVAHPSWGRKIRKLERQSCEEFHGGSNGAPGEAVASKLREALVISFAEIPNIKLVKSFFF
jgi:hypothetical protein